MILPAWIAAIPGRVIVIGSVALALVLGVWWHGREQYRAGVAAERVRWEAAEAAAREAAIRRGQQQQAAVIDAERRDSAVRAEIREKLVPIREEVIRYVEANPDRRDCVDPAVRMLLDQSIAAANAAAGAAAKGG